MRLARLLLQAFGPFTDTVLDFSGNGATRAVDLHLIYGPNEAGKSSALRAMTDLRFGIPPRSPDDFVHASGALRIAGVFIDAAGDPVGLIRRKGRGQTLSRFAVATGQPDGTLPVLPEHERALTGGLERAEFEAMFGLNHARLREGGDQLVRGEGELGSALFEASAGTRGIGTLLATLDADAKKLFNPHGRTQHAVINEARREIDTQRQTLRQAQTRPNEWQALNRAHETAKAALDDITQTLDALRRRENELAELRTVEPLLKEHDRVAVELQALAGIADLAADARAQRLASEQALRRAQQDSTDADLELARCVESLAALVIEPPVLEHADAIDRLVSGVEAAARSRIEVQREKAVVARIEQDLGLSAARLTSGCELRETLQALPSEADRVSLNQHLDAVARLAERLDGYRLRAESLDEALQPEGEEISAMPDPGARRALGVALREALALGAVTRQRADLERQIHELESQLTQALSDLGTGTEAALRRAQPLLDARIGQARQELAEVDEGLRRARDEDELLRRDQEGQRLRQRELAAEGEVVTAETLRLARVRRDEGWARIRRAYVERGESAEELARAFDPNRPLPEAFEAATGEADRQADLLRADAKRAAGFEECSARIEQMEVRRSAIDTEARALAERRGSLRAIWARQLADAGLPSLDPDALREWQGRRSDALKLGERLAALRADRDRLLATAAAGASRIAAALRALGEPLAGEGAPDVGGLPALIEAAGQWEQRAAHAEAQRGERERAARKQRADREKVSGLIAQTETELARHAAALHAWHARLFLSAGSAPDSVKARLDELDALARQAAQLSDAQQRQTHHQAVIDDLAAQAAQLARWLNEPVPEAVDDFADRLRKRLVVSRAGDQRRIALLRDQSRAQANRRTADTEQATQAAVQARLCADAKVESTDRLPEREDAAARKREARGALALLAQQLARASARSEHELRERLAGFDAVAIDTEREQCRTDIARREQEQSTARRKEEEARRALEAIDVSDRAAIAREAMESAAARYRAAVRPWARLRFAHGLLTEALNRFRDRAQAPMVAAASTYFALITGGRYPRLAADETGDQPVLKAERADGVRIGVAAMSEGTADQLYLALRLAALELRHASHPQMPLVLDDVLVTSDDARAANILRALARFAERGQVLLFTHHRHLIEVARATLGDDALVMHSL